MAPEKVPLDRPGWLAEGMDANSSYNLEIRIIATNSRARWYSLSKVVDADRTNFRDLVDEVVDKFPASYGDIVTVYYFCVGSKVHVKLCTDQDVHLAPAPVFASAGTAAVTASDAAAPAPTVTTSDAAAPASAPVQIMTPRRKILAVKKKITPKTSPAANTRSKKKLQLE